MTKTPIRSPDELERLRVELSEGIEQLKRGVKSRDDLVAIKRAEEQLADVKTELEVSKKAEHQRLLDNLTEEIRQHQFELADAEGELLKVAKELRQVILLREPREAEFIQAGMKRNAIVSMLGGALSSYGTTKYPIPANLIGEGMRGAQGRATSEAMREFGYQHQSDLATSMGYKNWSLGEVENLISKLEARRTTAQKEASKTGGEG